MSVIEALDQLSDLCGEAKTKGVHKITWAGFGIYTCVPEVRGSLIYLCCADQQQVQQSSHHHPEANLLSRECCL